MFIPAVFMFSSVGLLLPSAGNTSSVRESKNISEVPLERSVQPLTLYPYRFSGQSFITFWFDDAWESQYSVAYALLSQYHFRGALSVPTSFVRYPKYMDWYQIRELQNQGWEISSHTVNHDCGYSSFTKEKIEQEFKNSRQSLIGEGVAHNQFVSPCGIITPDIIALSKKYYKSLRTTDAELNYLPLKDNYYIHSFTIRSSTSLTEIQNWINNAQASPSWLILLFHEFDNSGSEYSLTPKQFHEIIKLVNKSSLQVAIPEEIMQLKYE